MSTGRVERVRARQARGGARLWVDEAAREQLRLVHLVRHRHRGGQRDRVGAGQNAIGAGHCDSEDAAAAALKLRARFLGPDVRRVVFAREARAGVCVQRDRVGARLHRHSARLAAQNASGAPCAAAVPP